MDFLHPHKVYAKVPLHGARRLNLPQKRQEYLSSYVRGLEKCDDLTGISSAPNIMDRIPWDEYITNCWWRVKDECMADV